MVLFGLSYVQVKYCLHRTWDDPQQLWGKPGAWFCLHVSLLLYASGYTPIQLPGSHTVTFKNLTLSMTVLIPKAFVLSDKNQTHTTLAVSSYLHFTPFLAQSL
jgi:hypothetical protein